MSLIKPAFFSKPFTAIKNRYSEIEILFYETYDKKTNTGTLKDLTGLSAVCDFRYNPTDSNPVFTLDSEDSPQTIKMIDGKLTLILEEANTELVTIPANADLDFPFVKLFFEIKIFDELSNQVSAGLGILHIYQNVTRSR